MAGGLSKRAIASKPNLDERAIPLPSCTEACDRINAIAFCNVYGASGSQSSMAMRDTSAWSCNSKAT